MAMNKDSKSVEAVEKKSPEDLNKILKTENDILRKEILRLQNVATNLEITCRTLTSLVQQAQLVSDTSKS